jgi:hypothetical protein
MSSTSGKLMEGYCLATLHEYWCARQGSNLRPSDSKSDALSN